MPTNSAFRFRRLVAIAVLVLMASLSLPASANASRTLNVKYDRQDRALSCEVAALKMALAYKGVSVSEDTLMTYVGYDATPRGKSTWGNPNQGFVGNINGRQNTTGYGAHWYPVRRAARKYRPADVYSWMTVTDLTREINRGNTIIVWGTQNTKARYAPWRTPSGILIKAWIGEHTRVVVGYRGSAKNPTEFILMDPSRGRITWTTQQLKDNWARFINSGVVVR